MSENRSVTELAFIGDAIYELFVRDKVLDKHVKVDKLHVKTVAYVNAGSQARCVKQMIDSGFLTEEEVRIVKRARNFNSKTRSKNATLIDYKWATGFEALIGKLYLDDDTSRQNEIMEMAAKIVEGK